MPSRTCGTRSGWPTALRDFAKETTDFDSIRDDPAFKELIGGGGAVA